MSKNWQTALYKIAQATREKKLKWQEGGMIYGDFNNSVLVWDYETAEAEDPLRIYCVSHTREEGDAIIHDSTTTLEFIDSKGAPLWRFPDHPAIEDIANAVRYQVNGIDDKLAKLFKI